jgi:hypothetical protein
MTVTVSQDAEKLDLVWVASDPVSLAFTVEDVDWSGTYTAQIRAERSATSTLIGTLTVTATFNTPDTDFTMTMTAVNSALIAAGTYYWDLQQTSGVTRLAGKVSVQPHVTA